MNCFVSWRRVRCCEGWGQAISQAAIEVFASPLYKSATDRMNKLTGDAWNIAIRSKQKNAVSEYHRENGCMQACFVPKSEAKAPHWYAQSWVPDALKHHSLMPTDLNLKGSVQIVRQDSFHLVYNNEDLLMTGSGKFIVGRECNCIVFQWPLDSLLSMNIEPENVVDFWRDASTIEFDKWCTDSVNHCQMCDGDVVWVPYGYQSAILTLQWQVSSDDASQQDRGAFARSPLPHYYAYFNYVCPDMWGVVAPRIQGKVVTELAKWVVACDYIQALAKDPECDRHIRISVAMLEWLITCRLPECQRGKSWPRFAGDDEVDASTAPVAPVAAPLGDRVEMPGGQLPLTNGPEPGVQTQAEVSSVDTD